MMSDEKYTPPVSKLLTYGDVRDAEEWPYYPEIGLRKAHVPDLIRMATDDDLHDSDTTSLAIWAPVHAWRALAQLNAQEAIEPLIGEFWRIEDGDEWIGSEMPTVMSMLGVKAIVFLSNFLDYEHLNGTEPRLLAIECLITIAEDWGLASLIVLETLKKHLRNYEKNYPMVNDGLVRGLLQFEDRSCLPLINEVMSSEYVPPELRHDWIKIRRELIRMIRNDDEIDDEDKQELLSQLKK